MIRKKDPHRLLIKIRQQKILLFMLLPAVILALMFCYLPLSGWYIAFSEYKLGTSMFGGEFVGLKYFRKIFEQSSDIGYLIRNTLVINLTTLFLGMFIAVLFALLLKELRWQKAAKLVQTTSFFPYFISWVITYSIVWSLFAVRSGAVNQFLVRIGVLERGLDVLGNPQYSWPLIILMNLWKNTGYNTIIFLASIAGISAELYEAAAIDGAGRFQQVLYVTLPGILPTASVLLIMNAGWVLNSGLDQFFLFSNTTNWTKMEVLDIYIYKFGLKLLDFPYSTAMGILKGFVSILLLLIVKWITGKINQITDQ